MENKIDFDINPMLEYAESTKQFMEGFFKQVEEAKKGLSPEEVEMLEKELAKTDFNKHNAELNKSLDDLKKVMQSL